MLALGIHYLTGYATATDAGRRDQAEWPPHPGRVYMALVAAHYETEPASDNHTALDQWKEEHAVLEWLEALEAPALKVSDHDERVVVTTYVPVNDKLSYPANRQPRTFPKVRPHDPNVFLLWPAAAPTYVQQQTLARLCSKVTRIGHSSSLVQMWLIPAGEEPEPDLFPASSPGSYSEATHLRITTAGCLRELQQQFNGEAIERFFDFSARIDSVKGKDRKTIEADFEREFGTKWNRSLTPPSRLRPLLTITRPYVRTMSVPDKTVHGYFDPSLLILAKQEGPNLGLESTAQLTEALRGALLKTCDVAPEWLTGHRAAGSPSDQPHLALIPLGFVGDEYADGHLLGLGLAFPRDIIARDRGRALRSFLYRQDGRPAEITLTLGRLGVWTLRQEERPAPPLSLRAETWSHASRCWASVTPVVLNRHAKAGPAEDRTAWFAEIAEIVAVSCEHSGLPRPVEIDLDKTSWHRGAPRALPGPDGFPLFPRKPGTPARQQIHIWLRFSEKVEGPVLIGAGRYRGYGLCKPCADPTP